MDGAGAHRKRERERARARERERQRERKSGAGAHRFAAGSHSPDIHIASDAAGDLLTRHQACWRDSEETRRLALETDAL